MRLAIFANLEYVLDTESLTKALNVYSLEYDVFLSKCAKNDLDSLCTGVKADYNNYDYVVVINPDMPYKSEPDIRYATVQKYYMELLKDKAILPKALELLECNPHMGMLSFPIDYVSAYNWEQWECWADYYHITRKWARKYDIDVPLSIDKPPVASCGACIVKTSAIEGINKMRFELFTREFISYALAIVCQHNGYLPQYIISKNLIINNSFGHETYTDWLPEVLKVKKEYYKAEEKYRKETLEYHEKNCGLLEERNRALEENCAALQKQVEEMKKSSSWKLTAPLRKVSRIASRGKK